MTSPTRCRSRSWGWTPTTDRNSSTTTCCNGANAARSPSPGRRPGNKNDGCHVEQKNWAVVRTVVGYHRYDTAAELLLLNEIWQLQSKLTNYFYPQQKLISKVRARRQGVQETRHRRHPVSSRDRSPDHDRGTHRGADPDLLADQPRRHPTPDPSPDRPAAHHHHQQSRTRRPSSNQQARTFT